MNMDNPPYAFPLAIQTTLPDDCQGEQFRQQLELLQSHRFTSIELNIVRPEGVDPSMLSAYLKQFGLRMSMLATGATAKAEGLSLSHPDSDVRMASVQRCVEKLPA